MAQIRTPAAASFLQDVALRDLAVHATHAACVDGRGDVYQWGDGFFGQQPSEQSTSASGEDDRKPVLTLQGKVRRLLAFILFYYFYLIDWLIAGIVSQNITKVQVTESRVFALSDSGKVYVIPAQAAHAGVTGARQGLTPAGTSTTPSSSSTSRWGSGWLWGDGAGATHAEIAPSQKLAWGER